MKVNTTFRQFMTTIANKIKYTELSKTICDGHKGPLNVLIELTSTQYKRIVDNTIHITKRYVKEKKVYYSSIVYGKNIVKRKRQLIVFGNKTWWSEIMMDNIIDHTVYITTTKDELMDEVKTGNIKFLDSTDTSTQPSGIVILMMCKLPENSATKCKRWGKNDHEILKKIKVSTNSKTHQHHGSGGFHYSFGNKAFYGKINNSSVSQYALKKNTDVNIGLQEKMEKEFSEDIRYGISNLSKHLPNIKHLISPVLDIAFQMQKEYGDVNLQEVELSELGIWKTVVTVNAFTKELHIEDDCTSTIIYVPNQETNTDACTFHFQFALGEKHNIAIHLKQCTTIMFCARFLTHRQTSEDMSPKSKFINFGCYGNRKLFNHIRQSFKRNNE